MRGDINSMGGKLARIIYILFGNNIGKQVRRVISFIKSGKRKINSIVHLNTFSYGYHTTCGYYDLDPMKDKKFIFITTDKKMEQANVYMKNLVEQTCELIDKTTLVNWQQGNRLRWMSKEGIIYNSFLDNKYISVEVQNNKRRIHKWPIYDVRKKQAVTLDFNRLGWMRPGYGYTKFPYTEIDESDIAIRLFDLETDDDIKLIRYSELINSLGKRVNLSSCYVNHLCFSPSGDKFLFFFVEIQNNIHKCYLGVYYNEKIRFLDRELSASHYTWRDEETILATSYDQDRNCGYYLYEINTGIKIPVMPEKMCKDGHPTYIDNTTLITDTYPDSNGFQQILLIDLVRETVKEIVSIYSSAKHVGVERCDLHPRYAKENNEIYFDADIDGHRRIYNFNLEDL